MRHECVDESQVHWPLLWFALKAEKGTKPFRLSPRKPATALSEFARVVPK
jgi:hypothetical protein